MCWMWNGPHTPSLFLLYHLEVDGGVQITGSHNPPEYNGFKVCLGKSTIYGEEIQKIRNIAESGRYPQGKGKEQSREIIRPYLTHLEENLKPEGRREGWCWTQETAWQGSWPRRFTGGWAYR